MKLGPELAGRYQRVALLARGGMADVLQADDASGTPVAIKVLREGYADDAEMVARFKREARAASQLKSKHVVRILDFGTTESERPFMVMERLFGHDLATEIKQRARLPLEEAAGFLAQACHAVIEAHAAGVVHRDLKPRNLFLAQEGSRQILKVLDFGIAKHDKVGGDDPITLTQTLFGSPFYMAPETFRSAKNADVRSDVWSLGVIFYEMLTGVVPFQRETALAVGLAVTKEEPVPATQRVPELPRSCDVVIGRALKKKPDERYQSVRELLAAIEVYLPTGRNDTMLIPTVQGPPPDDDARTVRNEGMVTEFHMVAPQRPSDPDDGEAPTRIRTEDDPATVSRMPLSGETSRAERPVAISNLPGELPPAPVKRKLPTVWLAVPAAALVFGLGGWLLGRPDAAREAERSGSPRPAATESVAAATQQPTQAPAPPPAATAPPVASEAAAGVPSAELSAEPTATPVETAPAQPASGGGSAPKRPAGKPKKKYTPQKI